MVFDMRAKPFRLLNAEPLTQTAVAVWVGLCCVLLATVAYWTVLVDSHRTQRNFTEAQSWLRVGQMSHAVSVQVQTLLSGLDYTMRGLESDFADGEADVFQHAVQTTFDAYPAGTFLQIAVADESGDIVYSNLQQDAQTRAAKVSIRDREHFQVHANRETMGMFIGRPVQGRVSHKWTIQLSRALYRQGRFSGVLVLSLSPDYISGYFQSIFDGAKDVILLLRTDGVYLARSQGQDEVMGRSVSDVRVSQFAPAMERGTYEAESSVDGVLRMYAWSRVEGYPLIVSAGLDKKAIFESLEESLERGLLRNGIGTAVLLLAVLLTLWLARQRQLSERMRLQGERRFARLAQEVPGGCSSSASARMASSSFPSPARGSSSCMAQGPTSSGSPTMNCSSACTPRICPPWRPRCRTAWGARMSGSTNTASTGLEASCAGCTATPGRSRRKTARCCGMAMCTTSRRTRPYRNPYATARSACA